jgi:hypothetical protein
MNYRNTEMKIDQILNYFNEEKINLSPAFQRGHVWPIGTRRKLLANIVQGKPIPAIFLYKEASGARYSYNILDGKQRLESLILFVGNERSDLAVENWAKYFFDDNIRKKVGFWVQLPDGKMPFKKLDEQVVRDFREYAIPTVEISLSEDCSISRFGPTRFSRIGPTLHGSPAGAFGRDDYASLFLAASLRALTPR